MVKLRRAEGARSPAPFHFGYVVFIGACLLMLPEALPINTASIFYAPVTSDLGIPVASFSVHTTVISLSIFLTMRRVMRLFERLDIRLFMAGVIVLEALCFFLYAIARSVLVFYISSFLVGISLGALVNIVVPVLVNNWFCTRANLYIGIGTCMQGVGGALFNALGAAIIAAHGWRACYVAFGIATLAIGLPVSLLMMCKYPADRGLEPIGSHRTAPETRADADTDAGASPVSVPAPPPAGPTRRTLLPRLVLSCLLLAMGMIFNYHINSYILDIGATIKLAGVASAMVMVGMCVGKVMLGALCDRSVTAGVVVGCGSGCISLVGLLAMQQASMPALCSLCLLFGITYAASSLLGASVTRHVFGPGEFNRFWPQISRFIALGNAAGSLLWGLVVQSSGYQLSMGVCCCLICIAGLNYVACVRASERPRAAGRR